MVLTLTLYTKQLLFIVIIIFIIFFILQCSAQYYYYYSPQSLQSNAIQNMSLSQPKQPDSTSVVNIKIDNDHNSDEIDQFTMIVNDYDDDDNDDYNKLYSHYISNQYLNKSLSSLSKRKITMIFVVGIKGSGHNIFEFIFDELSMMDPNHIIHLKNNKKLWKYLDQCWAFDLWGINDKKLRFNAYSNDVDDVDDNDDDINNINLNNTKYCDLIKDEMYKMINNTQKENDLVILSSLFSFPYLTMNNSRYPDIIKLIEWTQNIKSYSINLRLLILNRDYKQTLSQCLIYNDCDKRIPLMTHMLNTIHSQIMQIDSRFWIQINFTHFMENIIHYIDIFKSYFNVDIVQISKVLTKLNKSNLSQSNFIIENNKKFNELQLYAIYQAYYSSHVINRWPLFGNKKYMVYPNNNYHDDNYHKIINYNDLYNNYIHKNYDLLSKSIKKLTMIFVVGVEGVGHHFFRTIFTQLNNTKYIKNNKHYYQQYDRRWPIDQLWVLLDKCWAYDQFGLIKSRKKWKTTTVDISDLSEIERNMTSCDIVQKRINEYSKLLNNNSILFMSTHYSYPYDEPLINRYPDFVQLINWAQNSKPYPFDIRILILKRDYKQSLISSCVKRFGKCISRIPLLSNMLNVIHAQLMQIDKQFWIQINYTHLISNIIDYKIILSKFLNVKLFDIDKAINKTKKEYIKHNNKKINRKTKIKDSLNNYKLWAINQSYYSLNVKYRWPLFVDDYYLVTPTNDTFLRNKLWRNVQGFYEYS